MFDYSKSIEAIGKATEKGFTFAEKAKDRQSETFLIKLFNKKQKAIDIAEKIINLINDCKQTLEKETLKEFEALKKEFFKFNN